MVEKKSKTKEKNLKNAEFLLKNGGRKFLGKTEIKKRKTEKWPEIIFKKLEKLWMKKFRKNGISF